MSELGRDVDSPYGEEPDSLVSGPRRRQLRTGYKVAIALFVLAVFGVFVWMGWQSRLKVAERQPTASVDQTTSTFRPSPLTAPPPPPPTPPERREAPPPNGAKEMTPAESPIFAFSGPEPTKGNGPAVQGGPMRATEPANSTEPAPGTANSSLATKLQPTIQRLTKASMLPHPHMLITKGTMIPCILQTAINTQLPGFVKCVLPTDVRSTTGNVVLLDRGTVVTGEIQSGLMQGQDRVFVLWDRAETPDHAVITLASPGTDELGRSGLPGYVDTHFWQRFGSAILLSLVQGSIQAGTAFASNAGGNNGFSLNSFQSNGGQVADTALQASINIPPTLAKNQGDTIAIFAARDLDFSDVYSLRVLDAPR